MTHRTSLTALLLALGAGLQALHPAPSVAQDTAGASSSDSVAAAVGRQPSSYFFHRPEVDYGSASVWGPLGLMANRGLSNLVLDNRDRDLTRMGWSLGFDAVTDALLRPVAAIERGGGWGTFLRREFWAEDGRVWHWAWAPNYGGHIVAGGISYRQLWEWFEARGVRYPRTVAAVWYYLTMGVNEVVEDPTGAPGTAGAVADMYIFEPLGMLLFSLDGVAGFFAHTLEAADWSPQASLTPGLLIQNHGQVMSYKVPLPFQDRVRLLFIVGLKAASGVSVALDQEYSLGATLGFEARERFLDEDTGAERITPQMGSGLFLDRNGSLLASLTLSGAERVEANVFPGVLPGVLEGLGLWLVLDEDGRPTVGISSRRTLGLGFGMGR